MPPTIQAGTILMKEWPRMAQLLGLENEPCWGNWSLVKALDSLALDRKLHAAGWNFFFMAAAVRVMFFGAVAPGKIQNAVKRILAKVRPQQFNSLEVTGIVEKHFLGFPYAIVSAHSRHIQHSCRLDAAETRQTFQRDAEWARG